MFYGVFYGYAPLFYGKVVDFLDFDFFDITIFGRSFDRFPIFNVADAAVTIGVVLLLVFYNKTLKAEEPSGESPELVLIDQQDTNDPSDDTQTDMRNRDDDEPDNGKEIPL
jgi:signal peptidase II